MQRWGIADDGEVVEVAGSAAQVATVLAHHAPPCGMRWVDECPDSAHVTRRVVVDADGDGRIDVRVDGQIRPGGVDAVESELALFAAERLRGLVAVHAAVWRVADGVVVLPGASHAGKSTWSAAAMETGVRVWSDEFALVDAAGMVRGWPRPLRLRTPSGVVRRPLGDVPDGAVAAVAVVDVAFSGRLEVRDATESEAIGAVLANTVCAQRRPADSFAAAVSLVAGARAVTGTRGEATEAVGWLCEWLGDGGR